ncbi:MAG: phosphorylase family protein [Clostridiales bacterium]|jgi:purine-nucleoside phosphorylase|nr:phosphorylase family protein [Clostridiales bacterium]
MIYDWLLQGNERFGTKPDDICINVFNCEPEQINEHVIVAPWWQPDVFINFGAEIDKTLDCENRKIWNMNMGEFRFTYIRTGIGAPVIVDTALALGCTPCKKAIFIGSAGALDVNMDIGDIVIPEYSVCGDVVCRYLTNVHLKGNDMFGQAIYPNEQLTKKINSITDKVCIENNVKWHFGKNFSVDTIFAQFSHIDEIIGLGCNTIEMETAAFFKATELAGIAAGAVFSISDNSMNKKSLYCGRTAEEMQYRHDVRAKVIPQIVLEALSE